MPKATEEPRAPERAPLLQGPKRQHYLPEFYLGGFCRDGFVCLYDRNRHDYRRQRPKNTGVVGHLYTVRDAEDRQRFEIEEMLSQIEGKAAAILPKLENCESITDEERASVALFIALAFTRTPERLGEIERLNAHFIDMMIQADIGTPEGAARLIEKTGGAERSPFTAQALAEFVRNGGFKVKVANTRLLDGMLTMADAIIPLLISASWVVLHRTADRSSFVTTDSPVRLLPPRGFDPGFYGVGFGLPGVETWFPLSAATCLCLVNLRGAQCRHMGVNTEVMRRINLTMTAGCHAYVIGRDEALLRSLVKMAGIDRKPIESKLRIN